jgi:serine/threonine protein kinase
MGACLSSEAAAPKAGGEVSEDSDMHRNLVKKAGKKAEDAFDMGIQVGKGSASKIVLVSKRKGKDAGNGFHDSFTKTSQNNPGQYAIKLYDGSAETPPDLEREAEILRLCDHPNIVKLFELSTANNRVSLVLELCTGGTALDRMPLKEPDIRRIMRQLVSAVAYLHNKNIVHRDIELANILFEDESLDSDIKLSKRSPETDL